MKISKIALDNYRSYQSTNQFDLSEINILIGPNNSGKSNLIRSLLVYQELNLGKHSISQDQRHTGKREQHAHLFEIEFIIENSEVIAFNEYHDQKLFKDFNVTEFKHEIIFDPFIKKEGLYFKDSANNWISILQFVRIDSSNHELSVLADSYFSDFVYNKNTTTYGVGTATGLFQLTRQPLTADTRTNHLINTFLKMLTGYLSRCKYLPAFRNILHNVDNTQSKQLATKGDNLVEVLNYLQIREPKKYHLISELVYEANKDIENLTAPNRDRQVYGLIEEKGNVTVEISEFSTGLQQYLLIVTFLIISEPNSLLMIEEPEQNIHAKTQRILLRRLEEYVKQNCHQIIITSHSTIFAKVNPVISTFKIEKTEGISHAVKLKETSELRYIKNVLGHENSDIFNYNAVIIVEGETEEKALPRIAQQMNVDLVDKAIKIINIRGSGNSTKMQELVTYLKDSQTRTYLILDNHKISEDTVQDLLRMNIIKQENLFSVEKGFEDSFDDKSITNALNAYANGFDFKKFKRNSKQVLIWYLRMD